MSYTDTHRYTYMPSYISGMMLIYRILEGIDEALDKLVVNWLQEIIFIDVRDLVYCPRQTTFKRLNKLSENQNLDNVGKYLRGRLLTIQLQQILLARYPGQIEIEKQVHYNCSNYYSELGQGCVVYVLGRIDAFNTETGPIEFKTTSSLKKIGEPKSYDVQQIKYYMTMTNSMTGVLWYYHLDPKFVDCRSAKFLIAMTEDDLYSEYKKLIESALSLNEAISAGKPEIAYHIAYDRELAWMCKYCDYSGDCKDMRIAANGLKFRAAEKGHGIDLIPSQKETDSELDAKITENILSNE